MCLKMSGKSRPKRQMWFGGGKVVLEVTENYAGISCLCLINNS
jgi:hypothetical protein